jgi:FkbM family methyltransferase
MFASVVKSLVEMSGFDVRRMSPISNAGLQVAEILKRQGFNTVFDVGANIGQFGADLRKHKYDGRIVSFEPLSQAHKKLSECAMSDPKWIVHARCGLGSEAGKATINVAANLASSSILEMSKAHLDAAPYSAYNNSEEIDVVRLDEVVENYLIASSKAFLKVDTQGFEQQVLDGAGDALDKFDGALLELSLVKLYDGQKLWLDLVNFLSQRGLQLWVLNQGFVDPQSLRTLQVDGLFLRP